MNIKLSLKMTMSLLLIVIFNTLAQAQETTNLFENNYNWGVTLQLNAFEGSGTSQFDTNKFYYKLTPTYKLAAGLKYNFYQKNKWNFKAGLQFQWFGDKDKNFISKEETGLPSDWLSGAYGNNVLIIYVPITVEYMFYQKGNTTFLFGGGLGLSYFKYNDLGTGFFSINDEYIRRTAYDGNGNYFGSGHIEASAYFKTKKGLLFQTSIMYSKNFKPIRKGAYAFTNLQESPDESGTFKQSGDFIGLSLTVYLKKKKK